MRLFARSTRNIGRICAADSFDRGVTWTPAHVLDLPNPNSGVDALRLTDGRIVLVFNNSTESRTPLNIAVSRDGDHFRIFRTLADGPGEFSYPALIQSRNGDLLLTYTWNRQRIAFGRVPLDAIPKE